MAQKLMILRFLGGNADSKRRVWIAFFYDADEFDNILGQRKSG
jgi:hypothetical protein